MRHVEGGIFSEGVVSEQSQRRPRWEGSLRLILHTVDCVRGALRPAVPSQDVFEVAGLEFHMLKEIRGVLSNVSCGKREQGEPRGSCTPPPSTNGPRRGSGNSAHPHTTDSAR